MSPGHCLLHFLAFLYLYLLGVQYSNTTVQPANQSPSFVSTMTSTENQERPAGYRDSKNLLPNILDALATEHPEKCWAKIPKNTAHYEDGYRQITYQELANSVNFLANSIAEKLGLGRDSPTLAYFGPWDPRFSMLILAASKAGYKLLPPSPIQAIDSLMHLLKQTKCQAILHSVETREIVPRVLDVGDYSAVEIPSVAQILSAPRCSFPYTKTFEDSRHEPFYVLQTSGSTGLPKPIVITHDWVASFIHQLRQLPPAGHDSQEELWHGAEILAAVPPYHATGICTCLHVALGIGSVTIYPLPKANFLLDTVIGVLQRTSCDVLCVGPYTVDQLGSDVGRLDFVSSRVRLITYIGGPASQKGGDIVSSKIRLTSTYGLTESGTFPCVRPQRADRAWDSSLWQSVQFHPSAGTLMREFLTEDAPGSKSDSTLHELVVKRNPDLADEQPIFKLLPSGTSEWSTKDTFKPDPKHPGYWIYSGRVDDVLVFEAGAKYDPTVFEQKVMSHPTVSGAVMVGNGRPVASLIIEPERNARGDDAAMANILDEIWPTIEEANRTWRDVSQVSKDRILFTKTAKPMPRTAKGNIAKSQLLKVYDEEIERLYQAYQG